MINPDAMLRGDTTEAIIERIVNQVKPPVLSGV
jgi:hypothetical protein